MSGITLKSTYMVVTDKAGGGVTIVRTCADSTCNMLHYFTRVDDSFTAKTIVRALNNE